MLKHNPKLEGKRAFQVGDMGLGFPDVSLPETDNLLFIRGNHDSPKVCKEHSNYAGEYGYLEDEKVFFLGGAWSIDARWRIEGLSWWRDEEQSIEALYDAHQLYLEKKPLVVVTHEAPTVAALEVLRWFKPLRTEPGYTDATLPKGEDYTEYKSTVGFANTRTSQALQQMLDSHTPKHWVFGHYHVRRDFEINGTTFHCLPELDTLELNHADF